MSFSIGIDLGTTNTVVSTGRRALNGGVEVLTEKLPQLSEDGRKLVQDALLPSFLYVDGDDYNVGIIAKAMKTQFKNNVVSSSKNFIGHRDYKWEIEGKEYTPELVASYFLSAIRNYLKDKYGDEEQLGSAVITVPASFDIDQRNSTRTAAKLAGFDGEITLISEPTSAILDFINEQSKLCDEDKFIDLSDYKKVLVFDLGGGTCDVAILEIKVLGKEVYVEEIGVSPHTLIGGTNFDAYAVDGIIKDFEKENKIKLNEVLSKEELSDLKSKLLMTMEDTKVYFSSRYTMKNPRNEEKDKIVEAINLNISEPGIINGKPFKYNLTMKRYNEYISPLLSIENKKENIINPIKETLSKCNLDASDIDYIFCVGGMTRYPKVWDTISEFFGKEPLKFSDTMESVSRGAAIYHHYDVIEKENKESLNNEGENKDIIVTPKLPETVFLNVKNGFPIPIIEANTKAGTPILIEDLLKVTSETELLLELFSGRSPFDPNLKKQESIKLEFPHAIKQGSGIVLKLEYTSNSILIFEAWLKDNPDIKINVSLEKSQFTEEEIQEHQERFKIMNVKGVL
ncbi:Hsp70 family protein [Clostridium perfringens]|uniref:Hsp70 family protein n=1 Tax=Clostridium perfringens TaxID=1502 RepID=UPI0018E477A9|nr:Hsp70 family protein [Clostridium perfringens]MBI6041845.1 Hsp70 family protein [Clostridium perfringens]MBI6075051.1 Hsp70 family protein [Clostridium perfringens]MDK0814016.1 Hsp70 family protein [Clostridium perfringens]HAT4141164.1 Hsp70 family protein [Clostridium perfringens]